MKIAQLTDLHIGRAGSPTFQTDVRGNFLNVLALLRQADPDYLVVTGDLCFRDPDPDVCHWVRAQLEGLALPYDLISGNHDDPVMLAEIFERQALLHGEELVIPYAMSDSRTSFAIVSVPELVDALRASGP